jgi:hypothetical protein
MAGTAMIRTVEAVMRDDVMVAGASGMTGAAAISGR